MKVKSYAVLDHAINNGINYGWNRAHKHNDNPSAETIKEEILFAIMNEITEWFIFDESENQTH